MTKIDTSTEEVERLKVRLSIIGKAELENYALWRAEQDRAETLAAEVERLKAQVDEVWNEAIEAAAEEIRKYSCTDGSDPFTDGIQCGYHDAVSQVSDGVSTLKRQPKGESHE